VQNIEYEWACDVLSGIDSAVVDGKCLYCGSEHFFEALDDSHLFGKHLVYDHSFGKCDLDSIFKTWPELQAHLTQFHQADDLMPLRIKRWEQLFRRIKQQNDHHPHFHDIAESFPPELTIREENPKLTDFILQTELICQLTSAGILIDDHQVKAGIRSDLSRAIQRLESSSFQASEDPEPMFSRIYQVARLEGELLLSGYDLAIAPRRCPEFSDIEELLSLKRPKFDTEREVKSHFSKVWMIVDLPTRIETSSYIDHPFALRNAEECLVCEMMIVSWAVSAHLKQKHFYASLGDADFQMEERRGLRSSLVTMQFCRSIVQWETNNVFHDRHPNHYRPRWVLLVSCPKTRAYVSGYRHP
jgi:hypothetical protein